MALRKRQILTFLEEIGGIALPTGSSKTQKRAEIHERIVLECLERTFHADSVTITKEFFRRHIFNTRQVKELNYPKQVNIYELGIPKNQDFVIHNVFGSQNFPDLIMFNYDEDNNVNLRYIECKQTVPTFNNSPPKCEDHIMYVCGNDCYSGCSLICKDDYDRHLDFVERYRELCAEYTESNKALKFVPYKKIELKKFPPDCYDAEKNMELILKSFSDF